MKFTDSQKLACDISRNIAVTAGAGSGKTSVLVRRYLWCLEQNNYQIRRVAAITFTEKAAGEMLQRIRKDIFQKLEGGLGDLQRWETVLEQLPLAYISTIHGFCRRLLREFPIEAGVDPNFSVLDEANRHSLIHRLLDELIQDRAASHDRDMRLTAQLWTPLQIRKILRQLLDFREKSRLWSAGILQSHFPDYLNALHEFNAQLQDRKIARLLQDRKWQDCIARIPGLIPPGDTGTLSERCHVVLELAADLNQPRDPERDLRILGRLRENLSMRGVNKAWKEENRKETLSGIFSTMKTLYDQAVPQYDIHDALEQSSFQIQQALARLLVASERRYAQEKRLRRLLDFDDLQEAALRLTTHPEIQPLLAGRFDYLMVDEFQDTNSLQWEIISGFGQTGGRLEQDRFCIVGDEKQSIYTFRGADVAVFSEVRNTLQAANIEHGAEARALKLPELGDPPEQRDRQKRGELIMAENFRSGKELIFFFNSLFAQIFEKERDPERPFEVVHQEMRSLRSPGASSGHQGRAAVKEPVEFLLVTQDHTDEAGEAEQIARRILEFMKETDCSEEDEEARPRWAFSDIAILLRTRTRLKDIEDALRRYDIPFVLSGGIGFYEQQEIYDLTNLLCFLADSRQDIALAGVLRSPLFSFSDDQLFYVSTGIIAAEPPERWSLWERLQHHARTPDVIPAELDPSLFSQSCQQLSVWMRLAGRIPITHLLRRILDESGLYGVLSGSERAAQRLHNIEKLLNIAQTFESEGFQSLTDLVNFFEELISTGEHEGEAQLSTEGMNAVQLMTIHASKGLEFPIVFVPEIDRKFNYGESDSIYLDALPTHCRHNGLSAVSAGINGLNPDENYAAQSSFLRKYLKDLNREKTNAEMKRLLYVACTRAADALILSGTLHKKKDGGFTISAASWLAWFERIFGIRDHILHEELTLRIHPESEESDMATLDIPLRLDLPIASDSPLKHIRREDSSPAVPHHSEDTPGRILQNPALLAQMHRNLRPLGGPENELFHVSPSSVHLLYQCPRKYYYQEILGLKGRLLRQITPPAGEAEAAPNYGAKRGTIIHNLFEQQVFETDRGSQTLQLDDLLKSEGIPHSSEERRRLQRAIERAGEHYAASGLRRLLADSPKVYREYPFQLNVGQALISGVIDVLFRHPDRHVWTVLDYKSNHIEDLQIEAEIERHGYALQMQIYALAVSRLMQAGQVHGILFFTYPGICYEDLALDPKSLQAVEVGLAEHLRNISLDTIQAAENPKACEACEFQRNRICLR
ncbi:hypothetical protein CSB45_13570 [candidate division KSB3 bacterium]|uniref:DNA 3'-5' helicase n=1 Tax=candidate division KSB3 bacterium TaxID=2044937 RepID=A0A2G6E1Z8_9BACT|nr:MAG: hypothetical protein CSB45_13570 [candidate division KSB3 bacterium]PIE28588.1 MAG: hypothetical protein CSA57_13220 [candidate division KSB3 bacterium]